MQIVAGLTNRHFIHHSLIDFEFCHCYPGIHEYF